MADSQGPGIQPFMGEWKCTSCDNLDGFLTDMGVGWMKRKGASTTTSGGTSFAFTNTWVAPGQWTFKQTLPFDKAEESITIGETLSTTVGGENWPASKTVTFVSGKLVTTTVVESKGKTITGEMVVNDDGTMTLTQSIAGGGDPMVRTMEKQ